MELDNDDPWELADSLDDVDAFEGDLAWLFHFMIEVAASLPTLPPSAHEGLRVASQYWAGSATEEQLAKARTRLQKEVDQNKALVSAAASAGQAAIMAMWTPEAGMDGARVVWHFLDHLRIVPVDESAVAESMRRAYQKRGGEDPHQGSNTPTKLDPGDRR